MSKNEIKAIASPMTGCPAWAIAVFKAEDVPEGTEVFPAAPVQAQEPFMFGIMGPDGKAHIDENCVAGDKDSTALHIEVNCLNDSPDTGYSIVPLYLDPVKPVAVPDPLYQAMHDFRDDVLSGIDGLDNDQINAVLSTFDNYMLDDPTATAELQGIPTRMGVSTAPSDDGKTITVVGMAVQEGISFVFYTGNHSITQDASGFVDINFQRLMEKK